MNIGWLGQDINVWGDGVYDFRLRVKDKNTQDILAATKMRVMAVPEPSTLAIFALAIMGLASRRLKK